MKKNLRGIFLLLLTAFIWGTAFVAQSAGMDYVKPFTYNGIRTFIGGIVLLPFIPLFDKMNAGRKTMTKDERKKSDLYSVKAGLACGVILFIASSFQQFGISMTTAGKAGFITALYIILVPIFGLFLGKKVPWLTWLCVAVAIAGFFLLCVNEGFSVSTGDFLVLCCAFFFSAHILTIDSFSKADGLRMACTQFLTAGILSLIFMFITESPEIADIMNAKWTILYSGVMSCGVAYTLQIFGQRETEPTVATLIMSLESVFAALSGWVLLNESLSPKELAGCVLVFIAVVFAQIPTEKLFGKKI